MKIEQERAPRRRRGERRFIEERIEQEESELEALIAKKAKEEELEEIRAPAEEKKIEDAEIPAEEKKEDFKEYISESPVSSIFADKLKSALDKQKPKAPEKEKKGKRKRKK